MLACIALHNYLRTKSVEYSQAVADSETAAQELLPGEWRHNPNAQLPSVCKGLTGTHYRPGKSERNSLTIL